MPQFNLSVPHTLGKDGAKERLAHYAEKVEERFGDQVKNLEQSWDGDNLNFGFSTYGIKIDGSMAVEEDKVVINGNLPFTAMMFKGKIESGLREQLTRMLK